MTPSGQDSGGDRLTAIELRTNGRDGAVPVDTPDPGLAWRFDAQGGLRRQAGYAILLERRLASGWSRVWESGFRTGSEPWATYAGPPLASDAAYRWRVRLTDGLGRSGPWSACARFDTGKLSPEEWRARWITAEPVKEDRRTLYFRGHAMLKSEVAAARAYVSALGWYRFFVNGADVTGDALVPRWTPFDHVVEYQLHDVAKLLREGRNSFGFAVADGRFRGKLGGHETRATYGDCVAAFMQIEVLLVTGEQVTLCTGEGWSVGPGPIGESDPKGGERADLRVPEAGRNGGDEAPPGFAPAAALPEHPRRLIAESAGRVRDVGRLPPRDIRRHSRGTQIVDFGQNTAGVMRIRLRAAAAGTKVTLRFSELLAPDGELLQGYLMPPLKVTEPRDEVIASGEDAWWQPWFTTRGFRYVAVDGVDATLAEEDVEAVVLSSDLAQAGGFACSDPVLEQLWRNVEWTLRSNLADTATDSPTRERAGWLADLQIIAPTATAVFDCQAYLGRTLDNMALEQFEDGRVPALSPSESGLFNGGPKVLVRMTSTSTGWGDAAVLLPWTLHRYYGDERIVRRSYDMMRRWVDYLKSQAEARTALSRCFSRLPADQERLILSTGFHFGEWLRPGEAFLGSMLRGRFAPDASIATAYLAHSSKLLGEMADAIGRTDDGAAYRALSERVREAWRAAFVRSGGRIAGDRQDDYVRALAFDLLLPGQRSTALARLIELIEAAGDHLATGFLSTPHILPVLADNGRPDVAWRLLQQTTPPSWRYQVERGATTVWESWTGYDRKGLGRLSHNHYAFGSVAQWLREGVAGLAPAAPGFRRIRVAPHIGGGLDAASAWADTPYGRASVAWRRSEGKVTLDVTAPPGTIAEVRLGEREEELMPGRHSLIIPFAEDGAG